jgi:acetyltransferase EpsM
MSEIFIFPYSGSGLEVLDCLPEDIRVIFVTDNLEHIDTNYKNYEIVSRAKMLEFNQPKLIAVHGSVATYKNRLNVVENFDVRVNWQSVIHPSASISKFANIGKNVFISAGVSIGPNVIIEDHVIILANATIHHDSLIRKGSIICGNVLIAGNVKVESQVYVGASACVKNGLTIGENSLIGMGSVVLEPIPDNEIWYGNPAKKQMK